MDTRNVNKSEPNVLTKPKVMVIDDAFDTEIFVLFLNYQNFYYKLESDSKIEEFKLVTGLSLPDVYGDLDDSSPEYKKFINDLWPIKNELEKLNLQSSYDLFDEVISRQSDLDEICKNIENQQFEIIKLGSNDDGTEFAKKGEFKIIFLDHNLGANPGPEAIKNARLKAESLYIACPGNLKPIIILMSSYESVKGQLEQFRREMGIANIVFRTTTKNLLINDGTASLLVQAYNNESEHIHKLQSYISTLKIAGIEALQKFNEDIDMITIDDYAFIHNTTVMDQAHPLGDYLGWLYGAHWTNLLFKSSNLKIQKDTLDKLLMDKPALHHTLPSSPE